MRPSTLHAILGAVGVGGVVAFAAAFMWIGRLENRVEQLEKSAVDLKLGPRGQSCQLIVARLVKEPTNKALMALADKWGCSMAPAAEMFGDNMKPPPPPPAPQPER
jgi:hypothetical protein